MDDAPKPESAEPGSEPARPLIRLVVGLGNPGRRYEDTPHNLGFLVVDRLAARYGVELNRMECLAVVGEGKIEGKPVVLAKPQTFMNLSGESVRLLLDRYSCQPPEMLLIYDDLDLPWMMLRVRPKGSSGGHHGVESVIQQIGASNFPRLRIGIAGYRVENGASFVLSRFSREQKEQLDELLEQAASAAASIISEGVDKAMAKFNRRARGQRSKEE